ncbi:MAG TPA: sulfatase [Thermoanaerobaculia bacterium]|nr:sulfatase [Thermoanaerobaculia bacterium]
MLGLVVPLALLVGDGRRDLLAEGSARRFPSILLVTVDTLRADRLGSYGYRRPTSPEIDRLLAEGVRFTQARTVEPLTGPASISLFTSLPPHEHGATRNSLAMRPGLSSITRLLGQGGYRTAAFVGNWTLRDRFTGLAEHFDAYREIFSRKRWLGLFNSEATGADLTTAATSWLRELRARETKRPFFLWVHYVEPHAPYRLQKEMAPRLGVPVGDAASRSDRYDTEVAFVDREVGRLVSAVRAIEAGRELAVVFTADHGESLGEHGYWGHGRNVLDPNLRIPLGVVWPGVVSAGRTIEAPALILDVAPTLVGLLGLAPVEVFRGFDWSPVLRGEAPPPEDRLVGFQAHRGAVTAVSGEQNARENGLLEVAILSGRTKEVLRLETRTRRLFDLGHDPGELQGRTTSPSRPSPELAAWLAEVRQGLRKASDLPAAALDAASLEQLKALGYVD